MARKKFYTVAVGRTPGIYTDWQSAEKAVKGFAGARYKSFPTRAEAEAWYRKPVYEVKNGNRRKTQAGTSLSLPVKGIRDRVFIYTDGGCSGNPGPGGYGIVILDGNEQHELSEGFRLTTNNRMELLACIVALKQLDDTGKPVEIFSDSSYVVNAVTKGWARSWRNRGWRKSNGEPAQNSDLWQLLLSLCDQFTVRFTWLKGHAGHEFNERCDRLAVAAAKGENLRIDAGYETADR